MMIAMDKWLLILLKHNQYCWENLTMIRYNVKNLSASRLRDVFSRAEMDEYNEGKVTTSLSLTFFALTHILRDDSIT